MDAFVFRSSDLGFRESFIDRHALYQEVNAKGVDLKRLECNIEIVGRLEVLGGVVRNAGGAKISFNHPVYRRVHRGIVPFDFEQEVGLLLRDYHFRQEERFEGWRRIQLEVSEKYAKLYIERVREIYREMLGGMNQYGELQPVVEGEALLINLMAVYEWCRNSYSIDVGRPATFGICGGNVIGAGDLTRGRERLLREWLISIGDQDEFIGGDSRMRIELEREYRFLILGDCTLLSNVVSYRAGNIRYSTVWFPRLTWEECYTMFRHETRMGGIHLGHSIPVPHYFVFETQADLECKVLDHIRQSWHNFATASRSGYFFGDRVNENMVLNCEVSDVLGIGRFASSVGLFGAHVGKTVEELEQLIRMQGEMVASRDIWENGVIPNRPLRVGVWEYVHTQQYGGEYETEAFTLVEVAVKLNVLGHQLDVLQDGDRIQRVLTAEGANFESYDEVMGTLRVINLKGSPIPVDFMHLFSFWSPMCDGVALEAEDYYVPLVQVEPAGYELDLFFLRHLANKGNTVVCEDRVYNNRGQVRLERYNGIEYREVFPARFCSLFGSDWGPEVLIVTAWAYCCEQCIGMRMVPDDFLSTRGNRVSTLRGQFGLLMLRLARSYLECRHGNNSTAKVLTNVVYALAQLVYYMSLPGARREGVGLVGQAAAEGHEAVEVVVDEEVEVPEVVIPGLHEDVAEVKWRLEDVSVMILGVTDEPVLDILKRAGMRNVDGLGLNARAPGHAGDAHEWRGRRLDIVVSDMDVCRGSTIAEKLAIVRRHVEAVSHGIIGVVKIGPPCEGLLVAAVGSRKSLNKIG